MLSQKYQCEIPPYGSSTVGSQMFDPGTLHAPYSIALSPPAYLHASNNALLPDAVDGISSSQFDSVIKLASEPTTLMLGKPQHNLDIRIDATATAVGTASGTRLQRSPMASAAARRCSDR